MAINTIKATIQMRHGMEDDFDPDQMTTGEWAVSTDSKKVWMCFVPGIVMRMSTYEAFEEDMKEIQIILSTCQDIQVAVERFKELAEQHKNEASNSALLSESWAHGGTGVRAGEDVDNSEYWSGKSKQEADRAKNEADRAEAIAGLEIDSFLSETSINPVQNKVITEELNKKLNKDGDASNVITRFSQSTDRINIASGEKLSVILGKIQKFFTDLKTVAFTNKYSDLDGKPTIPPAVSVKGNAESSYRTGTVNITPGNLGFKSAGATTQPVYFSSTGLPVACSYTLGKSVPSNAVFTDTNTWRPVQDNLTSDSASDSLSARQGKLLLSYLKNQIVKVDDAMVLTSSTYFNLTSSTFRYNKYTGEVHIRLAGSTKTKIAAGTEFILGYVPEKYAPDVAVPSLITVAVAIGGTAKGLLNAKNATERPRALRARANSEIASGYLIYAEANYYIDAGIT